MTKLEIINLFNGIPDDQEIDLIVSDVDDNRESASVVVETFACGSNPELILNLPERFVVSDVNNKKESNG